MKRYTRYGLPLLLIMIGGSLLIAGLMEGRSLAILLGAGLALGAGLSAFALQAEVISKRTGAIFGALLLVAAISLALNNYFSKKTTSTLRTAPSTIEVALL